MPVEPGMVPLTVVVAAGVLQAPREWALAGFRENTEALRPPAWRDRLERRHGYKCARRFHLDTQKPKLPLGPNAFQ